MLMHRHERHSPIWPFRKVLTSVIDGLGTSKLIDVSRKTLYDLIHSVFLRRFVSELCFQTRWASKSLQLCYRNVGSETYMLQLPGIHFLTAWRNECLTIKMRPWIACGTTGKYDRQDNATLLRWRHVLHYTTPLCLASGYENTGRTRLLCWATVTILLTGKYAYWTSCVLYWRQENTVLLT